MKCTKVHVDFVSSGFNQQAALIRGADFFFKGKVMKLVSNHINVTEHAKYLDDLSLFDLAIECGISSHRLYAIYGKVGNSLTRLEDDLALKLLTDNGCVLSHLQNYLLNKVDSDGQQHTSLTLQIQYYNDAKELLLKEFEYELPPIKQTPPYVKYKDGYFISRVEAVAIPADALEKVDIPLNEDGLSCHKYRVKKDCNVYGYGECLAKPVDDTPDLVTTNAVSSNVGTTNVDKEEHPQDVSVTAALRNRNGQVYVDLVSDYPFWARLDYPKAKNALIKEEEDGKFTCSIPYNFGYYGYKDGQIVLMGVGNMRDIGVIVGNTYSEKTINVSGLVIHREVSDSPLKEYDKNQYIEANKDDGTLFLGSVTEENPFAYSNESTIITFTNGVRQEINVRHTFMNGRIYGTPNHPPLKAGAYSFRIKEPIHKGAGISFTCYLSHTDEEAPAMLVDDLPLLKVFPMALNEGKALIAVDGVTAIGVYCPIPLKLETEINGNKGVVYTKAGYSVLTFNVHSKDVVSLYLLGKLMYGAEVVGVGSLNPIKVSERLASLPQYNMELFVTAGKAALHVPCPYFYHSDSQQLVVPLDVVDNQVDKDPFGDSNETDNRTTPTFPILCGYKLSSLGAYIEVEPLTELASGIRRKLEKEVQAVQISFAGNDRYLPMSQEIKVSPIVEKVGMHKTMVNGLFCYVLEDEDAYFVASSGQHFVSDNKLFTNIDNSDIIVVVNGIPLYVKG